MAEAEELGQWTIGRHLQQSRQMSARPDLGGSDSHAERCLSRGPGVQRAPSADVRDFAEGVANEVPLAVDLFDDAFPLKHCESTPQCRRAHHVLSG